MTGNEIAWAVVIPQHPAQGFKYNTEPKEPLRYMQHLPQGCLGGGSGIKTLAVVQLTGSPMSVKCSSLTEQVAMLSLLRALTFHRPQCGSRASNKLKTLITKGLKL